MYVCMYVCMAREVHVRSIEHMARLAWRAPEKVRASSATFAVSCRSRKSFVCWACFENTSHKCSVVTSPNMRTLTLMHSVNHQGCIVDHLLDMNRQHQKRRQRHTWITFIDSPYFATTMLLGLQAPYRMQGDPWSGLRISIAT